MTKILVATFLLFTAVHATVLSPNSVIGFTDSSFNYNSQEEASAAKFCYFGNVNEVCAEIKAGAYARNVMYYQGSHDKMNLVSCVVSYGDSHGINDSVKVAYTLSDDYGSFFKVDRKLSECTRSELVK